MKLVYYPNDSSGIQSPLTIPVCGSTSYQLVRGSLEGFGGIEAEHFTSQTPNQNGMTYYYSRYNERELKFKFRMFATAWNDLQRMKQTVSRYFSSSYGLGKLQIYVDSADTQYYEIDVIPDGVPEMFKVDNKGVDTMCIASVSLTAYDPYFRDGVLQTVSFSQYGGGFQLPFTYPFTLGEAGIGTIRNNGASIAPVVITLNGPFTNPVLTNERTGETIKVEVSLSEGEQLVIDTDPHNSSVTFVDSAGNETNMFYAVSVDSVLWKLQPGMNIITYGDSGYIGDNPTTISWRNEYTGVF